MDPMLYLLSALLVLSVIALVFVVVRLSERNGDLQTKLMAMTQAYPTAAYIELQRAQIELQQLAYRQPQAPQGNPFGDPEEVV